MFPLDDTIAAVASAPGGALRGIVRLSGPGCLRVVERLGRFDRSLGELSVPACMSGEIDLPDGLGTVPVTLYFWPTSRSYTREPSAELHLPGSVPIVNAALAAACAAGARLARPGEFTLRAFLAGRLDLTQAEAVLGVIDAADKRQLNRALAQLAGGLARPLAHLRERLLDCLAHLEAGLDFADEDIEFISREQLASDLAEIREQLAGIVAQMTSRGEASESPRVVLYGLPNTGKSSLLNALAADNAALVSPAAGTTRDYVACRVTWSGRDLLLSDTAGVVAPAASRGGDSSLDSTSLDSAIQHSTASELSRASLSVLCLDATRPLTDWEAGELARPAKERLVVRTKCELPVCAEGKRFEAYIATSSRTGLGLEALKTAICSALFAVDREAEVIAPTAERCRESLRFAAEALARAECAADQSLGEELVAAELRLALEELGRVVGAVYTEDILDRVFGRFCIGK